MALDFVAGCVGGCAGVLVGHPFDTIKVHLQTQDALRPMYRGTFHCMQTIVQKESSRGRPGGSALWRERAWSKRGAVAVAGAGPVPRHDVAAVRRGAHQRRGVRGVRQRAAPHERARRPAHALLRGRRRGRGPELHLQPHRAGQDAHPGADVARRGRRRGGARAAAVPGARGAGGGRAWRVARPGRHGGARLVGRGRVLRDVRVAGARHGARGRPAAVHRARAAGRRPGRHRLLDLLLPGGRRQVQTPGGRHGRAAALLGLLGLLAAERARRGAVVPGPRAHVHGAARLPHERGHLRRGDVGVPAGGARGRGGAPAAPGGAAARRRRPASGRAAAAGRGGPAVRGPPPAPEAAGRAGGRAARPARGPGRVLPSARARRRRPPRPRPRRRRPRVRPAVAHAGPHHRRGQVGGGGAGGGGHPRREDGGEGGGASGGPRLMIHEAHVFPRTGRVCDTGRSCRTRKILHMSLIAQF